MPGLRYCPPSEKSETSILQAYFDIHMPRLRYCWPSEKWRLNFTRTVQYRRAQIAILLTVAKFGMLFYEGNLILTCLDCETVDLQKSETSTLWVYFDIDMHGLRYCWPVQKWECNFTRIYCYRRASIAILVAVRKVRVQFNLDNLMSGCAKWRSVVQNHTSAACCEKHNSANLMDYCSKVDFPW